MAEHQFLKASSPAARLAALLLMAAAPWAAVAQASDKLDRTVLPIAGARSARSSPRSTRATSRRRRASRSRRRPARRTS